MFQVGFNFPAKLERPVSHIGQLVENHGFALIKTQFVVFPASQFYRKIL